MVHISFNLLFDSEMEQVIRAFSSHLVEAGIPERALVKYQPHITLVAYEVEKVHLYKTPLTLMASALDPFPLFLDSLGIFPEQGVIFLAPRIFDSLLSLHRATTETFMSMSEHERPSLVGDYLLPGRWIPHVTLAKHLPIPHVLKALEVCLRQWTPVQGHATGIGMRVHPDPANYHYYSFHSSPG